MHVTVIGTGYVGTVTGACLSYLGHHVICVDNDTPKIESFREGNLPIYEPHLDEAAGSCRASAAASSSPAELAGAVAAATSSLSRWAPRRCPTGEANLRFLEAAARSIGAAMDDFALPRGGQQIHRPGWLRQPGGDAGAGGHRGSAPGGAAEHPLRSRQQSGIPARGQRRGRLALSRPHCGGRGGRGDAGRDARTLPPLVAQSFDAASGPAAPGRHESGARCSPPRSPARR